MVHLCRRAVEDEVAGLQRGTLRNVRALVVLGVGRARQRDARRGVGEGGQARAVEAGVAVGRPVAAPDVGQPDLGHRRLDRDLGALVGQRSGELRLALLVCRLVRSHRRCGDAAEVGENPGAEVGPLAVRGRDGRGVDHVPPNVDMPDRERAEGAGAEHDEEHRTRRASRARPGARRRAGRSTAEFGLRAVDPARADPELRHVGIFERSPLIVTRITPDLTLPRGNRHVVPLNLWGQLREQRREPLPQPREESFRAPPEAGPTPVR